jgi:hypothetical protein
MRSFPSRLLRTVLSTASIVFSGIRLLSMACHRHKLAPTDSWRARAMPTI